MRSSVVRSFRRAATLCAAALIGAWIGVSQGLAEARELARFQLDGEERKKAVREPTLCACLHPCSCMCLCVFFFGGGECCHLFGLPRQLGLILSLPKSLLPPPTTRTLVCAAAVISAAADQPSREVVASLRRTLERCHSRVEELRSHRSVTFQGVFAHRFRCVQCVVTWGE